LPLVGHVLPLGRDLLGSLDRWAEEVGDIYRVDIPSRNTWVVNRPDEIERVLVHGQYFIKDVGLRRARALFGNGLLTSDGEVWKKQRRMMQPAFHRERVAGYGSRMVALADQAVSTWTSGEVRDVHKDAMALSLKIATDTLFGDDEVPTADVGEALEKVMRRFDGVVALLPSWLPLPVIAGYHEGIRRLEAVVYDVLSRRRQQGTETADLLSILLHAQDDEGGGSMSDQQIRDEVLTLLIASHETNANALAWTWHLLARNPEAEGKLFAEVDALQETPTASDLAKLSYTSAVVNESMRLYPPAWTIVREVVRDWDIAGSRIRPGMQVAMSPWVVQRDRRFFPDPLRFRPERWLDGSMDALPTYAYFPFGGGQRLCIGRPFALLEGSVVLATVARHWRLRAVSDREVVPLPSITLRPRGGLPMRVERR
jgi:cytochrome P450